jgi:hypothetical protein
MLLPTMPINLEGYLRNGAIDRVQKLAHSLRLTTAERVFLAV